MNPQNKNRLVLLIVGVLVIAGAVFAAYTIWQSTNHSPSVTNNSFVGNDRDTHGCIGSAGYSWCEAKQKCLRVWEEPCDSSEASTASNIPPDWKNFSVYPRPDSEFQIAYPPNWQVSELSWPCTDINASVLGVISPIIYDAPGYETTGAYYLVQFCVFDKATLEYQGFIKLPRFNQGIPDEIILSNQILQNTPEYKLARKIIDFAFGSITK